MPPVRVSILVLIVPLLMLASTTRGAKQARVDAASRNSDDIITLYAGDDYLTLMDDEEMETGRISDIGYSEHFDFTAASDTLDYSNSRKYGADFYTDYIWGYTYKKHYSAAENTFFGEKGPDAVAECKGEMFYFKGCNVVKSEQWSDPKSVSQYGLPCAPDAAWKEIGGYNMIVLKGDQIWIWDCLSSNTMKMPFSSKYTMTSWVLKSD